ncbi:hypothetical protein IWW36_001304 [Coemansia brasiliensis]|uniref:Uncharacterized protein n=1 Tax=Coemansia brasiliensis TaxID=2650707 RepID=A0A9W8IFN2_9FUNG|nr:hypothetical protein IWW36_001304 [Coemansia brasiliensis]
MRFSLSFAAFSLASLVAASPVVLRRGVVSEVNAHAHYVPDFIPTYPSGGLPGGHFPGGSSPGNNGGNGNNGNGGNGNNGNGNNGNGNNGNGGNGDNGNGNNGNGDNGNGNNGNGDNGDNGSGSNGSGGKNACGVTPGQISALTPLLNKLGLSTTVDGVKQLVDKLINSVDGLLESPGVNGSGGLVDLVNNVVKGLLGQPLDLHNTVDALTSILENQVPCLLDTLLPKP